MERPPYYGNPAGLSDDVEIVRAFYAAFARRDVEAAAAYMTPDCELHLEGTARITGRTVPYVGPDGIRAYFADVARVWDELELHADDFRLIPGSVIVIGHVTGRTRSEIVRRSSVWTWHLRDGRVWKVRASDMGVLAD